MKDLPKIEDFKTPEGYFDRLPEETLSRRTSETPFRWYKYAASAILAIGISFGIYEFSTPESDPLIALDSDVNLYIEGGYWSAEDILSLSDDPDEILDQILEEESFILEDDSEVEFLF